MSVLSFLLFLLLISPGAKNMEFSREWVEPQISIPGLDIVSPLTRFYLGTDTWDIPQWEPRVGHLDRTSWITGNGNIVLAGHAEYPDGSNGVFSRLPDIAIDDQIVLSMGNFERRFSVTAVYHVALTDLSPIYPSNTNQLTLITCDVVSYNPNVKDYDKRLVVIAEEIKNENERD